MNPREPNPTPADDQPVSDVARRVGPPLAIGVLAVTAALLAWMALAPTAIAGPLEEAPFVVPATLVVPPDDDGCLVVVQGDGTARHHCRQQFAADEERYVDAFFDDRGRLLVGTHADLLEVDPATGEVLGSVAAVSTAPDEPPPLSQQPGGTVVPVGDRVVRDTPAGEVVLDLEAPPGWDLQDAALSPDGAWVVATGPGGIVVVAPTDGTTQPYRWLDGSGDRHVRLFDGLRWEE